MNIIYFLLIISVCKNKVNQYLRVKQLGYLLDLSHLYKLMN